MDLNKFKGVFTALITPFKNNKIDFQSLEKLIDFQLKNSIDGFVVNGTTAESPNLDKREVKEIFDFIKGKVPKNFPLILGSGSNSTANTVLFSKECEAWGADALLLVVPYYNKPPQRGLFEHFKTIASSVNIPSILYNVPGRTITALEIETIKKLSEHPQIIGIKEASGNIEFAKQISAQCGESFILLSGDDLTYEEFMQVGGHGCISVASHVIPKEIKNQRIRTNRELIEMMFSEGNPIPVKKMLQLMGIISSAELRLPLVESTETSAMKIKAELNKRGLL
jgi:4-hydroxy-tetrahydrodipicolinate synthase